VSQDTDSFNVEQSQERLLRNAPLFRVLILLYSLEINYPSSLGVCTYSFAIAAGSTDLKPGFSTTCSGSIDQGGLVVCNKDKSVSSKMVSILSSNSVFTVFIQYKFAGSPEGSTYTISGKLCIELLLSLS